jgi:hypothetical protein
MASIKKKKRIERRMGKFPVMILHRHHESGRQSENNLDYLYIQTAGGVNYDGWAASRGHLQATGKIFGNSTT